MDVIGWVSKSLLTITAVYIPRKHSWSKSTTETLEKYLKYLVKLAMKKREQRQWLYC